MAESSLSEFQKKKIFSVFNTFFDCNADSVIEWADFEIAIEKISKLHNWPIGGEKHKNAYETIRVIWDGLKGFADENQDDRVTIDEWYKMWEECINQAGDTGDMPDWCLRYRDFMFDVNDTSGDDKIDLEEYTTVYTSYGVSKQACATAFNTFANNGSLDRSAFGALWREYFFSDNPSAKGNYLFGGL